MDRRELGLFGTLFSFCSPLLTGLLAAYDFAMKYAVEDSPGSISSTYLSWPQPPLPAPLGAVLLGWLALSLVLHVIAWVMNGKGTFLDTVGIVGRMVGVLGVIEAIRLAAVLNGLNPWAGFAWLWVGCILVPAWTGRSWGKIHLLSWKETLAVTATCFYAPPLVLAVREFHAPIRLLYFP